MSKMLKTVIPRPGQRVRSWDVDELNPDVEPGDIVTKFGVNFEWTALHRKGSELESWRQVGDDLADRALEAVGNTPSKDVFSELLARRDEPGPIKDFMDRVTTVPDWVNPEALRRGQQVFARHSAVAGLTLLHLSLVGGFSVPKINKVLASTGYLAGQHTVRRLYETGQMVVACMEPGGLKVLEGAGWKDAIRVRFLHAKVRTRLLRMASWDRANWGVAINQEDMAATVLSFQMNVIEVLDVAGHLSPGEAEDYTHLWRYIAYLMGVMDKYNPCESLQHSRASLESILMHVIHPDETSSKFSNHVLDSVASKPPFNWSRNTHAQLARMMMGDPLADALKITNTPLLSLFHRFNFFVFYTMSRLTYLPLVGDKIAAFYLASLQEVNRTIVDETDFSMTHEPSASSVAVVPFAADRTVPRVRRSLAVHPMTAVAIIALILLAYRRGGYFAKIVRRFGWRP